MFTESVPSQATSPSLPHAELLLALDALVMEDRFKSGLRGVLAFTVRGATASSWWVVTLKPTRPATTRFVDELPSDVHVAVGLDEAEARALLTQTAFSPDPESLRLAAGDLRLLSRFITRYVRRRSYLASRSAECCPTSPTSTLALGANAGQSSRPLLLRG